MSENEDNQYSEELSELVSAGLAAKEMSIKDLSNALEVTYEHARRLVKGFPPSKPILRLLAAILELDFDKLEEVAVAASIRRRFGDVQLRIEGKDPEMEPVARLWKQLKDHQKGDILAMMKTMAKRSKEGVRG